MLKGKVGLWPKGFTAKTYGYVFEDDRIFRSYGNTILYTVLGTTISLSITAMGAYALSAKRMIGHKFFSMMIVFTMFFQGGMIPTYLDDPDLFSLQLILHELLSAGSSNNATVGVGDVLVVEESLKYATVLVSIAPIMCVYPFLQKYFVKGVMIGAVKG